MSWQESLPKLLNIGSRKYSVETVDLRRDNFDGVCHNSSAQIQVCTLLPARSAADIVLHEALHAMFWNAGTRHLPSLKEEFLVSCLTQQLSLFFQANPEFMSWFLSCHEGPT